MLFALFCLFHGVSSALIQGVLDEQVTYRYWSDYKKVYVDKWLRVEVPTRGPHVLYNKRFVVT